jgi:plastocyanin
MSIERSRGGSVRRVLALGLSGLLGVVGLSACGGDEPTASKNAEAAGATVHIKVFQFRPDRLKVKVGATVTWVNDDDIEHTVTSGTRQYEPGDTGKITATQKDGLFDTPLPGAGKKTTHTFAKAGTFHYFCDRHPGMEADVEVA